MKNANDPACPKCGAALPPGAPQDLCPGCALEGIESVSYAARLKVDYPQSTRARRNGIEGKPHENWGLARSISEEKGNAADTGL